MDVYIYADTKSYAKYLHIFKLHITLYDLIARNEVCEIKPAEMLTYIKGVYAIQTTNRTNGTQHERFIDTFGDHPIISAKMNKKKLATILRILMQSKKPNAIYLGSGGCDYCGHYNGQKGRTIEFLDPNESGSRFQIYKCGAMCRSFGKSWLSLTK